MALSAGYHWKMMARCIKRPATTKGSVNVLVRVCEDRGGQGGHRERQREREREREKDFRLQKANCILAIFYTNPRTHKLNYAHRQINTTHKQQSKETNETKQQQTKQTKNKQNDSHTEIMRHYNGR